MEDIDGELHPVVDGQSLDEEEVNNIHTEWQVKYRSTALL